jgi:hypothetical protein
MLIAAMAAVPCMWSGVEMVTAMMELPISANILRKPANVHASGWLAAFLSGARESTSKSATMFPPAAVISLTSESPLPPTPMQETLMRVFLLGMGN